MTIVITGASRGIGTAMAAQYEAAGEKVIGTARGAGVEAVLDVTDPASHVAFARTLKDCPLDLLICNAGVYLDKGDDLETGFGPDLWAQSFATNVTGVFLTVQSLLPNLRAASGAKIAIIASQMGSSTRAPGGSYIYRTSKAAAINLGRNLAVDLKPEGIAVVAAARGDQQHAGCAAQVEHRLATAALWLRSRSTLPRPFESCLQGVGGAVCQLLEPDMVPAAAQMERVSLGGRPDLARRARGLPASQRAR